VQLFGHPSLKKQLLESQLQVALVVLQPLENFEQGLHLMLVLLNEIVHLHLEGLLCVSSCASSGD
jgi:hypothetical protein